MEVNLCNIQQKHFCDPYQTLKRDFGKIQEYCACGHFHPDYTAYFILLRSLDLSARWLHHEGQPLRWGVPASSNKSFLETLNADHMVRNLLQVSFDLNGYQYLLDDLLDNSDLREDVLVIYDDLIVPYIEGVN